MLLGQDGPDQADDLFARTLREAGIEQAPEAIQDVLRQSVLLLDHATRSRMPDYGHAFQPLLHPLDEYALHILEKGLRPGIPDNQREQYAYFSPCLDGQPQRQTVPLERHQRYLRDNLVFGRSMQPGTLLFCLDYAQQGDWGAVGIWQDVEEVFSRQEVARLYPDLNRVNSFRNTRVAHVEAPLDDADEAWKAMGDWLRCLCLMHGIAGVGLEEGEQR